MARLKLTEIQPKITSGAIPICDGRFPLISQALLHYAIEFFAAIISGFCHKTLDTGVVRPHPARSKAETVCLTITFTCDSSAMSQHKAMAL
jgi:hypothetical protein